MLKKEKIAKSFQYSSDQGFLLLMKAIDRIEFEEAVQYEEMKEEKLHWLQHG